MTTCACRQHLNATLWGGFFSLTYFLTKYNKKTQKRRFVKFYGAWLLFEKKQSIIKVRK